MISKSQIHQYIRQLYSQELDADALDYELLRVQDRHAQILYTLVELFDTDDVDFKAFIVRLVEQLEDLEKFPILSKIIFDSNKSDEIKIYAATIMGYLGSEVDYYELRENLAAPDDLDEILTRNMLQDLESPYFFEEFLKLFPELEYEQKLAILDSLEDANDDPRLAEIAGALIDYCDSSEMRLSLIQTLRKSQSNKAYPYLKQIIQKSSDRQVQALARKAIFQLGELDKKGELIRIEPKAVFHEAYITNHDGSGHQICIFTTREQRKMIKVFSFVLCDSGGIKDAFGNQLTRKEYSSYLKNYKSSASFIIAKVPPEHIIRKAKQIETLSAANAVKLPTEYLAWRSIFNCRCDDSEWKKKNDEFDKLVKLAKSKEQQLIARTPELFEDKPISASWHFNYDQLETELQERIQLESESRQDEALYANTYSQIFQRAFKKVVTDKEVELFQGRLKEYAYLCFLNNKIPQTELALVAANTLHSDQTDIHPFMRRLVEYTFEVYLEDILPQLDDDDIDQMELFNKEIKPDAADLMHKIDKKSYDINDIHQSFQTGDEEDDSHYADPKPALLPENSDMTTIERLEYLCEMLPEVPFSATFPTNIFSLPAKKKILLLNLWEASYDSFIYNLVGDVDWYDLREEIGISIDDEILEGQLEAIDTLFLGAMPERGYEWEHLRLARRLWKEFIFLNDGEVKPMRKPEAWAAAVEYLVGALYYDRDPQAEVADDYGVSAASLAARYKTLKETLNLEIYPNETNKAISHIGDLLTMLYKRNKEDV